MSLGSLNHFHVWWVSPQLSCNDTYQLLTWYSVVNQSFYNGEKSGNDGVQGIGLVPPTWKIVLCGKLNVFILSLSFQGNSMVSQPSLWNIGAGINHINTLRQRQNGRHFADCTFKRIFLNENSRIVIKISLKFVPKGPINNIPALVQIMAWRRPGDKPLSDSMVVRLPTHICIYASMN